MDTGINGTDPPDWPPGRPTHASLEFLELALTNGIPEPPCGDTLGSQQSHIMAQGILPDDPNLMLPIEGPGLSQSSLDMSTLETPKDSNLGSKLGSLSFDDLSMMVVDDVRDALLSPLDEQDADSPSNTTNDSSLALRSPPPRLEMPPLRPQLNGILRLDCSIHAPTSSPTTGVGGVSEQQTDDLNGPQRPKKCQLAQGEADLEPPEGMEAQPKPKRIIKIKSRAAVLYVRELNKREEIEDNIERRIADGETRPSPESAHFDGAVWSCDAGFDVPGDYSWLDESR